jgi:hypothetical protein
MGKYNYIYFVTPESKDDLIEQKFKLTAIDYLFDLKEIDWSEFHYFKSEEDLEELIQQNLNIDHGALIISVDINELEEIIITCKLPREFIKEYYIGNDRISHTLYHNNSVKVKKPI